MFDVGLLAPANDLTTELEFAYGLASCYRHYGVGDAIHTLSPTQRPNVWHVTVRDNDGAMVGGARIHKTGPGSPLPALRAFDDEPALRAALVLDAARLGPPIELAALWVDRDREGLRGLGRAVAQASVAAARQIGAARAVTFSHHTLDALLTGIGMRPVEGVDPIAYPDARYRSTVYDVDPRDPSGATPTDLEQIESFARAFASASHVAVVSVEDGPLRWQVVEPVPAVAAA